MWETIGEEIYKRRSNNHKSNYTQLKRYFVTNGIVDDLLLAPVIEKCSRFRTILSFVLADRLEFSVRKIDNETKLEEWGVEECERVGVSLANFIRKRDSGEAALEAWRYHFDQLNFLFDEVEGFSKFMSIIANNMFKDSIYGTMYRVGLEQC